MYKPGDDVRLQNGLVGRILRVWPQVAPWTIYDVRLHKGQNLEGWDDRMDVPADQIKCRVHRVTVWQDIEVVPQ